MKKVLLLNLLSFAVISLFAQSQQVGLTTYDLQTNNSGCRRVVTNAAGEVAITYTKSYTYSEAAADRGTGYNYKNASGVWSEVPPTTAQGNSFTRHDIARTGWSNIGLLGNGNEVVVSHFADDANSYGGLQVQQRTFGSGAWSTYQLNSSNGFTEEATWPRMAVSGDSILVVSSVQIGTYVNGVDGGLYLHRSLDGGATWTEGTISFVNGNNFVQLGADVYAIDANDNGTVAMVVGRYNAFVLKSTDWGATWTTQDMVRTTDYNGNPNANNYSGESVESAERQDITDESYSLVVDDDGDVHVWAGRLSYEKEEYAEGSVYPFTVGLLYWNETMSEPKILHSSRFTVESGADCIPAYTSAVASDPDFVQFSLYASSLVSQPSGSYNDNGDLVVAYSRMRTGIVDTNDLITNSTDLGYFYKDVYLLKSSDNGETWQGPINVSNVDTLECAFPGIPRKYYNDIVPVIWQQDPMPGNALQEPTGYSHGGYYDNAIMYKEVNVASVVDPADETCPTFELVDAAVTSFSITAGCPPSEEEFGAIFEFDDVPMGPDVNMVRIVGTAPNLTVAGSYVVDLYLEDDAGNTSDTITNITINVVADNTPPTYTFIGPDTLNVILGNTYTDPGIEYTDNGCDPTAPLVETDNVNPTTTTGLGFTTYEYEITDNAGNTTTAIRYVEVITTDNEAPIITLIDGPTDTVEVCTSYDEKGATAFDLVDFSVPVTIDASAVDVNTTGSYTVTYTAQDNALIPNATSVTRTVYVVDNTAPVLSIIDDTDYITPANSFTENGINYTYEGESFVAPATSTSDPNCSGQIVNVSIDDSAVDVNNSGNYTAVVTATDENGNSTSQNLTVRVGKEPTADFEITQQTSTSVILNNTSTDNPTAYFWDFGNGQTSTQINSSAGTPIYTVNDATYPTYEICLTVTNRYNEAPFNKTSSTTCQTVTISGIADRNELDASINIYPNPTNGLVNVEISETGATDLSVEITNILGSVIATKKVAKVNNKEVIEFDLSKNAAGVYFVNISSDDASTSKRVIVK